MVLQVGWLRATSLSKAQVCALWNAAAAGIESHVLWPETGAVYCGACPLVRRFRPRSSWPSYAILPCGVKHSAWGGPSHRS